MTKGQPLELVTLALGLGLTELGESYVQECRAKASELELQGSPQVGWHLLGHLQSNKTGRAARLFQTVESVDSLELARRLGRARVGLPPLPALLEVALTGLPGRSGLVPEALLGQLDDLLAVEGIVIEGLMTVALSGNPAPAFQACRQLLEQLRHRSGRTLPTLSMGMSQDFPVAIQEGSTEVRIGTRLFGPR